MAVGTRKRKGRKKEKVENLYKILGTRSNISQDKIKEKYIEKLKEFPPETHPEEFQEIRGAYETLKDVKKRKQYDMLRKYGDKLEKTMEDVIFSMSIGEFEKAQTLIEYVLNIEPDNIAVKLTQAQIFLEMDNLKGFYSIINKIIEDCDDEDMQYAIFTKLNMLLSTEYYDEALTALENYKEYITDFEKYHEYKIYALLGLDDLIKAWGEFKNALPHIDDLTIDNLDILLLWLNTGIDLEKWGEISKIKNYFLKLSRSIHDEYELNLLYDNLLEEAEEYADVARFREADVFMQLASEIFKNDNSIKERRKEIQSIVKIEMELDRSSRDRELIPYVHVMIVDMFLKKYSTDEIYQGFLDNYPHDMMEELKWMKEDIAHGVLRIKKKYRSLYKEFNKELTILFNESTDGLNREQRRGLR